MLGGHRSERIAEEIRNEVSLMLAGELKDPRLAGPVTSFQHSYFVSEHGHGGDLGP